LVYSLNKIPRGRAKAPKVVQPVGEINAEDITGILQQTKLNINSLKDMKDNHYFAHPYFGKLNLKPTIKFLRIHTHHHLKIINDIIR
ncbi:MAG: hypothetical protein ABIT07_13030, partial [Ferruginibacter sp.]